MMNRDSFSTFHPAVNFVFFIGALTLGMVIQHPAYLIAGFIGALSYYIILRGTQALKMLLAILPLCIILALVNPLFNREGSRILFHVFGNPYTLEALLYGAAIAWIFLVMMLWFGCYSVVMTGDKFTSLLGNLIPSLSLLLVMIFRMVPGFIRKAQQISGARKSIGKGVVEQGSYKEKAASAMTVLASLTTWALEGSIVTADSMRSRGYGTAKRTSFTLYRMTIRDWVVLATILVLALIVLIFAIHGSTAATYTPQFTAAPLTLGFAAYCAYLLIPTILHIKEALQWHISRSKI